MSLSADVGRQYDASFLLMCGDGIEAEQRKTKGQKEANQIAIVQEGQNLLGQKKTHFCIFCFR